MTRWLADWLLVELSWSFGSFSLSFGLLLCCLEAFAFLLISFVFNQHIYQHIHRNGFTCFYKDMVDRRCCIAAVRYFHERAQALSCGIQFTAWTNALCDQHSDGRINIGDVSEPLHKSKLSQRSESDSLTTSLPHWYVGISCFPWVVHGVTFRCAFLFA